MTRSQEVQLVVMSEGWVKTFKISLGAGVFQEPGTCECLRNHLEGGGGEESTVYQGSSNLTYFLYGGLHKHAVNWLLM